MEFSSLFPSGGPILLEILVVKTLEHKEEYNVITISLLIFNIWLGVSSHIKMPVIRLP